MSQFTTLVCQAEIFWSKLFNNPHPNTTCHVLQATQDPMVFSVFVLVLVLFCECLGRQNNVKAWYTLGNGPSLFL